MNTTTVQANDNIITLLAFATGSGSPVVVDSGFEVKRNASTTRQFYWSEANGRWTADTDFRVIGNSYENTVYLGGGTTYYVNGGTSNLNALNVGVSYSVKANNCSSTTQENQLSQLIQIEVEFEDVNLLK